MTVTFLTGASSGIGRSLARRMACSGDTVVAVARRKELLDSLVGEIAEAGGRALAIRCDVTRPKEVQSAVEEAQGQLGPIDRLVANAGGGEPVFVDTFEVAQIRRALELNVLGTAHCLEALLPGMLDRGRGHLVSVSSLAGYRGLPSGAAYSAAKAALTNLMESLRIDLAPRGVDVTVIHPGFVRTRPGRKKGKPLQVELEAATLRMQRVIQARRPYDAFPLALRALLALARVMPPALYDRLLAGRGRMPGS